VRKSKVQNKDDTAKSINHRENQQTPYHKDPRSSFSRKEKGIMMSVEIRYDGS
jgi:hypothetical protein